MYAQDHHRRENESLKAEALELERDASIALKAAEILPDARVKARELTSHAHELKAEAEALKVAARLEDLHIWQMEKVKTTKKGLRAIFTGWALGEKAGR